MERAIDQELKKWKKQANRKPLLIRGARQVGKTYTIRDFAKKNFSSFVEINLERETKFHKAFDDLNPQEILNKLIALGKFEITPGETLLFIDEIQEYPKAITALRYFYEEMPNLHVIAAGSLVEFSLFSEKISMPVGRIDYLFMGPLSFFEFLIAIGKKNLKNYLENISLKDKLDQDIALEAQKKLKKYFIVGGMPEVVKNFGSKESLDQVDRFQNSIVRTYRDDFSKYATRSKHRYLQEVFNAIPRLVSRPIKYSQINKTYQSRELKNALNLLNQVGCVHKIKYSAGHGMPLESQSKTKRIKAIFMDLGLMQKMLGLSTQIIETDDLLLNNIGPLTEQFVGQELLAKIDPWEVKKLYFWFRDKKGSQAEVDYLINSGSKIYPVEVKAGKTGTLKSLRMFLESHPQTPFGLRFSMHELSFFDNVLSIPLCLVSQWERLANEALEL